MFDKLEDLLIRFEEILSELNEPTGPISTRTADRRTSKSWNFVRKNTS